ncbi:MAG: HEAT repeat domain-containing protein [Armatimonadetes bacterium]|nr:HEAT repeat domain-containing protein [Armatimonadota bacterium]
MLASLIAFSALVKVQNPQFPKPDTDYPAALQDSTVFPYLTDDDKKQQWKPFIVGPDWSNLAVPAPAPDATKLKVLLVVAERDFSDPRYSNIMETRDKTRLLEAVARLKSMYLAATNGSLVLDIVPRFYPDAIFDIKEFKNLIEDEYNESKFVVDDNVERGPFAATLAISSSHVDQADGQADDFTIKGFADLGGSSDDVFLEKSLFDLTQQSIQKRLESHLSLFENHLFGENTALNISDPLAGLEKDYWRLFNPDFRQDGTLLTQWATANALAPHRDPKGPAPVPSSAVESPGKLTLADGVLTYGEYSLLRAGSFALPMSAKFSTAKSLKFDIKATTKNPIAVQIWSDGTHNAGTEVVLGSGAGMVPITSDDKWQTVTIDLHPDQKSVFGVTFGVPHNLLGTSRLETELTKYDFRNFTLTDEPGQKSGELTDYHIPVWSDEESLRTILTTGTRAGKRFVLRDLDRIKTMKGVVPELQKLASDVDSGIAYDATRAYFTTVLSNNPTDAEVASLSSFFHAPPTETAREAALSCVPLHPTFAAFSDVTGCTVRLNWHVRKLAMAALGALDRANVKEKIGCEQTLLVSTRQEMATLRLAALKELDPKRPQDLDRLVSIMVNDPCESVRLYCLGVVANSGLAAKQTVLGCLADDSPTLREKIPAALGAKSPYLREALDKMVVDADPYVRVSALRSLAAAGDVKDGEIQNVFTDAHPAVQIEVLEGAKKGAWKIPADALDKLKASPIPYIAAAAKEMK